jgi:hypothetical protein
MGEAGAGEATEANPLFPSLVVPYEYRFALIGMKPCGPAGDSCTQIELASAHDPDELNNSMTEALARVGLGDLSFDSLVQDSRVSLLTDPETLLTYEFTMTKLGARNPRRRRAGPRVQALGRDTLGLHVRG